MIQSIYENAVLPAYKLLPEKMHSDNASRLLLAIGLQESALTHRRQMPVAHARGLWQFERGGGVAGVLQHRATAELAKQVCAARGVNPVADDVWQALEFDDVLAAAFARLLLWTDPKAMPADAFTGFDCYLRTWRPGAYTRGNGAAQAALKNKFIDYYLSVEIR